MEKVSEVEIGVTEVLEFREIFLEWHPECSKVVVRVSCSVFAEFFVLRKLFFQLIVGWVVVIELTFVAPVLPLSIHTGVLGSTGITAVAEKKTKKQ